MQLIFRQTPGAEVKTKTVLSFHLLVTSIQGIYTKPWIKDGRRTVVANMIFIAMHINTHNLNVFMYIYTHTFIPIATNISFLNGRK